MVGLCRLKTYGRKFLDTVPTIVSGTVHAINLTTGIFGVILGCLNFTVLTALIISHKKINGFMDCSHQPAHLNYECFKEVNKSSVRDAEIFRNFSL
jgi:hypothetical protein